MSDEEDSDEIVGYGRPPKSGRFQAGRSGNPLGRPKATSRSVGTRQLNTDIISVLDEPVMVVTKEGKKKKMSRFAVMLNQQCALATKGNIHAAKLILSLYQEAVVAHERTNPETFKMLDVAERMTADFSGERLPRDLVELLNRARSKTKPR